MNKEIVIIGAGGHAKSCIDVISLNKTYRIIGIIGLENDLGLQVNGYDVIGVEKDLKNIRKKCENAFIGIGQIKTHEKRKKLYEYLSSIDFNLPTIISPKAYVSPRSRIGTGTIIMHDAIVNAGVTIENNCIINTKALVEHDSVIKSHCHIATGAIINGTCNIGEGSFIGSGTIINNNINIGKESFIASSKNIFKHQNDFSNIIK